MFVFQQRQQLRYKSYIMRIQLPSRRISGEVWSAEEQVGCDTGVEQALDEVMNDHARQGWQLHSMSPIEVERGGDQAFLLVFSIPADMIG
jgi:hypothetical protein